MSERNVIISGWTNVDPEKRDEVVENFKDLVLRARNAPGCFDMAITVDTVDPSRINIFEFWRSEEDLNSWRAVSDPPKEITPIVQMQVQKHVIQGSGPPF